MTEVANPQALKWFRRTTGCWTSERRYLFAPKMKAVSMTTKFTIGLGEYGNQFIVEWTGQTEGVMELTLVGSHLHRSRDYFGDGAHGSDIEMIDDDTMVLRTEYDGMRVREEIRLLESDSYRLRQTIAFGLDDGKIRLAGQYLESRTL